MKWSKYIQRINSSKYVKKINWSKYTKRMKLKTKGKWTFLSIKDNLLLIEKL